MGNVGNWATISDIFANFLLHRAKSLSLSGPEFSCGIYVTSCSVKRCTESACLRIVSICTFSLLL